MPTARNRFVYYPPVSHIVSDACPTAARGWSTVVELEHPTGPGDGALVARGSINSGFVLYIKDGRPRFDYNSFHVHTLVSADAPLAPGAHRIELKVTRREDGGGDVALEVDGASVGKGSIGKLLFLISSTGMDLGRSLSPVNQDYVEPFTYPGRISQVVFETPGTPARGETRANARAEMTRQ